MSYIQAVNIIKGVSEAVNPDGIFVHGRTWDASLEFSNLDIQIYLYPFTGNVDLNNSYFESYQITMGFYFQDAPDSTNENRQDLIQRADNLTREFLTTLNLVEGVEISNSRTEPSYRKMAGTYTGYLLTFTLGIDTNVCGGEVEPDIPRLPAFCEKVKDCLSLPTESGQYVLTITNEVISWEEFSVPGLSEGNGTTINGNKVDLGGNVIQDTILQFDPNVNYISFGSEPDETLFYYGNFLGDGIRFGSAGNKFVNILADLDNDRFCSLNLSEDDGTGNAASGLNVVQDGYDYGIYNFYNGGKRTANIYFGLNSGSGTTDISRIEANINEVHGRHIIDSTGVLPNYNGFHANDTYTQLEYNKDAEDGQATGTCLTLNEDGINHFQGGAVLNQFDNSGNLIFGDAITDGTWKFFLDSGNFSIQKREGGIWVTKQTWA